MLYCTHREACYNALRTKADIPNLDMLVTTLKGNGTSTVTLEIQTIIRIQLVVMRTALICDDGFLQYTDRIGGGIRADSAYLIAANRKSGCLVISAHPHGGLLEDVWETERRSR